MPTSTDLQVQFDPTYSTQLSPSNDLSNLTLQTVRLGSTSGGGGFNVTGNSLTLTGNSLLGYAITDYGNNTWGLNTTFSNAATILSNKAGTTLTLSGTLTAGSAVTISGAGNVTFTQVEQGNAGLTMNGTGTVSLAPMDINPNNNPYIAYGSQAG